MNSGPASVSNRRLNGNLRQLASFGTIGVVSTAAYVIIYAWLRQAMPAAAANAVALLVTAVGNTAANRRLTFEVRGRTGLARDHAAGLLALGVALALTTAAVGALDLLAPNRGRTLEIAVLVLANLAATLARFALLRVAIARRAGAVPAGQAVATLSSMEAIQR
jgi:putative flippase GtrA